MSQSTPAHEELIYTIEQVAEILQLSTKTVYRHVRSGRLDSLRIGRRWRIPDTSVKAFMRPNPSKESTK